MILYSLQHFKTLQLHIRTITAITTIVNLNTFCKCKHDTFLRKKKSCREMRREKKISCRAFTREKKCPAHQAAKKKKRKKLLTRNHPPPPPKS